MGRTETGDRSRKEWGRSRGVRGTRKGERDAACVGMDQCVNGCCLTRTAEIIVSGPDGCFEERRDYYQNTPAFRQDSFDSSFQRFVPLRKERKGDVAPSEINIDPDSMFVARDRGLRSGVLRW